MTGAAQRTWLRACLALAVSSTLVACGRDDGRGVQPTARAAPSGQPLAPTTDDASTAAAVKAALSRDAQLGSLSIEVRASGGQVVLRGNAPDTATRTRASLLTREVTGVSRVDNEIKVQLDHPPARP